MKTNKRLTEISDFIILCYFQGCEDLNLIPIKTISFNEKTLKKLFKKKNEIKFYKECYGFYNFKSIIINSDFNEPGSKMELGTLVHELVHHWQDSYAPNSKTHGKKFEKMCYKIGKQLGWTKKQIRVYIIE